uniref:Uncharacterized protein n=1 Tax=Glossina palpalis gambiensis TaxID=67801 RepID=A0A1B0B4S2_9MUSC
MDQLAIPEHRGLEMLPRASRVSHQLRAKAPQPHPLTQTISPKTDTSSRVGLASSSAESSCPNNNNNGRRELVSTEESIVYYQPGLLRNFRLILWILFHYVFDLLAKLHWHVQMLRHFTTKTWSGNSINITSTKSGYYINCCKSGGNHEAERLTKQKTPNCGKHSKCDQ